MFYHEISILEGVEIIELCSEDSHLKELVEFYQMMRISVLGFLSEQITTGFMEKICFFRIISDFYAVWKKTGGKIHSSFDRAREDLAWSA